MHAFLARGRLDRQIAAGRLVGGSSAAALRCRQLSSAQERHAIAASLANILDAAEECQAEGSSRLMVEQAAVIDARDAIVLLIARLRGGETLEPRGLALARVLARDRRSPMFSPSSGPTIRQALAEIDNAL